jgi:hypothetical protein
MDQPVNRRRAVTATTGDEATLQKEPRVTADRTTLRRALVVGLAALAAALGLFTVLPASAASVIPTEQPGNAKCPAGTTELKVEPVESGTESDGTLTVTLVVTGNTFNWTSNIGVDVVIVKGGNASNVYDYRPDESTGDTGLHAPANASGQFAGLSHVSFCYDVEAPTTTTSTTTTTTTTSSTSSTSSTMPTSSSSVP